MIRTLDASLPRLETVGSKPERKLDKTGDRSEAPARSIRSYAPDLAAVELSAAARRANSVRGFSQKLLEAFERKLSPAEQELLDQAGRGEYLRSIASPLDTSAEATAERILGGITGYIYGAFRLSRGELSEADLDSFARDASRGFEQGLGEARGLLEASSALSAGLATDIDTMAELVRDGLAAFIRQERERLFG